MDRWAERLYLFGFSGREERHKALLKVLEANGADLLDFLVFDTEIAEWELVGTLRSDEKQFLTNVSDFEKNISPL